MAEDITPEAPPEVIAKIQKLLARTKDGSGTTDAEADTALNIAQRLASKWNLDIAAVEAASGKSDDGSGSVRVKEEMKGRAMYKWQRTLAKFVAEANFCYHMLASRSVWIDSHYKDKNGKHYTEEEGDQIPREERWALECVWVSGKYKTTKRHVFVGRKNNVITAQMMYQYLTQTIEDNLPIEDNAQRLSRSAMSWKEGCADRLCERLSARRKDLIAQHDAKVKQAEADQAAARDRWTKEQQAREKRKLPGNPEAEVKHVMDVLKDSAYDATGPQPEPEEPERPADDATGWTPGDTAAPEPAAPTSSALVLASVYDQSEREANEEMALGYTPGTFARWRKEREERDAKRALEEAEEAAKAVTEKRDAPIKQETERQRLARERREQNARAVNRRRWAREDAAEMRKDMEAHAKRDHKMYAAGAAKGKEIGLDGQIKAKTDQKKLGS